MSGFDFRSYTALYEPKRIERIRDAIFGNDLEEKKRAKVSLQKFFEFPRDVLRHYGGVRGIQQAGMQAFALSSDFPLMYTSVFDVFNQIVNYDDRWMQSYKLRSFDPGRNFFEIVDVTNAFTFDKILPGEKVSIKTLSGARTAVTAVTFAEGFGWAWELIEDRAFSTMVEIAEQFRDAWFLREAKYHYGLLMDAATSANAASAGTAIAWDTTGSNTLEKDIRTLGTVANTIGNAVKDLGVNPDPAMSPMLVYCNPTYAARLQAAARQMEVNAATSAVVNRNFTILPTYKLAKTDGTAISANRAIMIMPGGKIQRGVKLEPTSYSADDVQTFSSIQTMRSRIAAVVGEPLQTAEFALA